MASKLVRAGKHKTVNGVDYFRVRYKLHGGWRELYQNLRVKLTTINDAQRLAHIIETRFAETEDMEYAVAPFVGAKLKPNPVLPLMREYLRERELQVGAGLLSANTDRNLKAWLPAEGEAHKAKAKRKHYRFWESKSLYDVDKLSLQAFHRFLAADQKLGDVSRRTVLGVFKAFLGWALDMERIDAVPDFPKIVLERKRKDTYSREEQRKVLDAIPWPERGIFLLCAERGVRPGAARAVLVSAYDPALGLMIVKNGVQGNLAHAPVGTTKRRKQGLVTTTPELRAWIDEFARDRLPTARLFWNPAAVNDGQFWSEDAMNDAWRRASEAAGLRYVALYRGTKHSLASRLRAEGHSCEEIGALLDIDPREVPTYGPVDDLQLAVRLFGDEELTPEARAALKRWRPSDRSKETV